MRTMIVLAVLAALVAASSTVGAGKAEASNPVVTMSLLRQGMRVSHQIERARIVRASGRTRSREMCGYYVPAISGKVARLRAIVRQLYVYAPSSMRPQVVRMDRLGRRLARMASTMRLTCCVY